jgi:hypothetical protein
MSPVSKEAPITKEALFENFYHVAAEAIKLFEHVFETHGVAEQIFGYARPLTHEHQGADRLRFSYGWKELEELYEYAVNGIDGGEHPTDIVIGGGEVLSLVRTENFSPCQEWNDVLMRGDSRVALDEGTHLSIEAVAALAIVDVRTVRNAISSGELVVRKTEWGQHVENASAHRWLSGRRGFKPTVVTSGSTDLSVVKSPAVFGATLRARREEVAPDASASEACAKALNRPETVFQEVERGIFNLPLDSVFHLADFYRLDRKVMLSCVMRIFYPEQLQALQLAP